MESVNFLHQHQEEDHQLLEDFSSYGLPILNGTRDTNSRDVRQHMNYNIDLAPMSQDLGLLGTTNTSVPNESFMSHELQRLARIKNELSVIMSNNPQKIRYNNDNNQDMLFKTFSNGCQIKIDQHTNQITSNEKSISYPSDTNSCYRGPFSQIFPSINISNLNQPASANFGINSPANLDPFGSQTFNASLINYQTSSLNLHNLEGLSKDNCLSYGADDQMHNDIAPAFIVETTEAKRLARNCIDAKAYKATPTKKSKLELRPSCTPLKVRKEKLGDRISALQQMVAPFGKTDTASVLMEAIGYIKFLQNQVETLSVPYMNSTHRASRISTPEGLLLENGNEETKRDLRSRGLCLVPTSCLSYITYGCGTVWTTP